MRGLLNRQWTRFIAALVWSTLCGCSTTPAPSLSGEAGTGEHPDAGVDAAPSADDAGNVSCDAPLVFGYRGTTRAAPENSLPAFRYALEAGADGIEVDIHKTVDGVLVVFHDATTERTAKGQPVRNIADMTYAEVGALDVGLAYGAEWIGTRVPRLEEVLAILPADRKVILDLKADVEQEVALVIRDRGLASRALVSSFSAERLARFHALLPEIPLVFCMTSMTELPQAAGTFASYVRPPGLAERDSANWHRVLDAGYRLVVTDRAATYRASLWIANDTERALGMRSGLRPASCPAPDGGP